MGTDLGGQRGRLPCGKLAQAPLRCPQAMDAGRQVVVDLVQRLLELLVGR